MKNLKKVGSLAVCAAMAMSMVACGGSAASSSAPAASAPAASTPAASAPAADNSGAPVVTSTDKVTIVWSHNAPEVTAGNQTAVKFAERMAELSNGNITVEVHPNGELGSVPENDQFLREGTIQMCSGTSGGLTDKTLEYFDAPCLVTSDEQALELFGRGTELRAYTEEMYANLGIKVLSFMPAGYRETTSNVKASNYSELKGMKIRTLENPVPLEFWKDWGCNPTPIGFGELYVSLQQGLVEAQENTYDTIVAAKLYEQQKYVINTNHNIMWAGVYMNMDFYNTLPDDYKALLEYVWAEELDEYGYELNVAANKAALETMTAAGLEVIDFTDEDYAQMRADAKPAYDMIRKDVGDEIMDKIEAALA